MSAIVTITGWIAAQPETKEGGKYTVSSFSIPVNRGYDDNQTTTWFRITAFGDYWAGRVEKLGKGDLVMVSGEIETKEYNEKVSVAVYPSFIRKIKGADGSKKEEKEERGRGRARGTTRGRGRPPEDLDDEIPF